MVKATGRVDPLDGNVIPESGMACFRDELAEHTVRLVEQDQHRKLLEVGAGWKTISQVRTMRSQHPLSPARCSSRAILSDLR